MSDDLDAVLQEARSKYGSYSDVKNSTETNTDIDSVLAEARTKYGKVDISEPEGSFTPTVKSTAAGILNAFAGQPIEDIGRGIGVEGVEKAGKSVREFTEQVQRDNPSQINTLSEAAAHPWETVKTALGNVVPQLPVSLAGAYAGAKAGAALPLPPQFKAAAAGVGGILGAFGTSYPQEYAEMRSKQTEQGIRDIPRAALTAIPAAGLETAADVFAASRIMPKALRESAIGKLAGSFEDSGLSATGSRAVHAGKEALKGAGVEGAQEYAQSALEQYGGDQDLGTEEAEQERQMGALLGGIGGGAIRGGLSAFDAREAAHPSQEAETETPPTAEPMVETEKPTPEPTHIVEEPIAQPTVDESTLNRAKEFIGRWDNLQAEGRQPKSINENMLNAARSVGVENPEQITDPIEMLNAIRDSITVLEQPVPKTPGQTIVDDLESIKNKGPTVSAILNAKEAAAAAVDAQQAVNVPEQGEAPVIPEREQAVPGAEVVYQDLGDTGPEAYTQEWLAATDTKALETLLRTGTNKPGTGGLINDELKRRKELENAEQITETGEADGSRREQPEGSQENRDVTEPSAGVVPEGQADRNIPGIEEAQVEVQDGQSTNQAEKTATSEVAEDLERTSEGFQKYVPVKSNTLREAADFSEKSKAARAEEQTQEGDYQRGTVDIDGLTIAIENKKGTLRKGKDKDGNEWSQEMKSHYGEVFLRGEDGKPITGADGDLPDVFIAPGVTSLIDRPIFVIDQVDKDGNFDEHKVIMGPKNEKAAAKAYNDNYEKGWKGLGAITPMTLDEFKNWLQTEDVTKPVGNIEPAQPKKAPKKKYSPFVQEGDHLLEAIAKLGGLNRAEAKAQGIDPADFRKRGERIAYVFTSKGKSFDEMAELLRGYGFEYSGPNDLLRDVSDSLQTKRKIYSTKGAEIQAEELVDDYQLQFESDLAVLRDTAKRADELMPEEKWAEGTEAAISRGSVTPDTINEYIEEIDEAIAAKENPVEEELLQPQYVPPTPAKQPVAQQGDIFATTKKERDELAARQGVANFASAKDKKRNGNGEVEAEILTESGQEELPLVKSPEELPPDAVIRDIGAQKASGTTKLEAGGVLKVQNSGDLFNPNDPVIERFLDQADALPATKDSRSVTWTNAGNGFSARAYNSESMGPVLEIKSPSGAIVRKMKGRGAQDGEIVTDVEGTLDELFSGEAFNSFGEYFKNTPQLESGPMFSRPATRKQDDLAAIFSKLEYADAKADRDAILGDHPLKDQIDYIDQNFEKIFNALVKSDKNPEGKVERKCR